MVTLTGTIKDLNGLWVFTVRDGLTNEPLYIGCERLRTIPTLRELKRHALNKITAETPVSIEFNAPVADTQEGELLVDTLASAYQPRYKSGALATSIGRQVRCNETGEIYRNAHQAAKACGVNYSYIHYHLAGHSSYKTCKGLTFSYINTEE